LPAIELRINFEFGEKVYFSDIKIAFQQYRLVCSTPKMMTLVCFAVAKCVSPDRLSPISCDDKTGWGHEEIVSGR